MKKQNNAIIGIYKITNPKGKIYIGQTTNISKRKNNYKNIKCNKQPKIYNSLMKYGWEQHIFEVIEECSLNQLNEKEIYWGLYYDVLGEMGLNLRLGDANGLCSEETKQKMKKAALNMTPSHKEKLSIARINKPIPESTKTKMSLAATGRKRSEESKIKQSHSISKPKTQYRKSNKIYNRNHHQKQVIQYNMDMEIINEYSSLKEAKNSIPKVSGDSIGACCRNQIKTAYGYIWRFKT
jgi:group I intron endonuclease